MEASTWDVTLSSLVNNLNRIRNQVIAATGEAWGTVSHSIAGIWAKFHATTGHKHSGAADDGAQVDHGDLGGLGDDDHSIYLKADGTRALSGDMSCGSKNLTSVKDPTSDQHAATKKYVDGFFKAWAAWTSTQAWLTGTPSSVTAVTRWSQANRIVTISAFFTSVDSNGCTGFTFTLPAAPANTGGYTAMSARVACFISGVLTRKTVTYFATMDGSTLVCNCGEFPACDDGYVVQVMVAGSYEV